jgi:threonine/homoserine/homoserine lactone efflux protein
MRVIGAVYILWLAVSLFRMSLADADENQPLLGFKQGFFLQFLNMKAILATMIIFTTFLRPLSGNTGFILIAGALLGVRTFLVNTTWCLFGYSLKMIFARPVFLKIFNIMLALALVYTALDLLGLPEILFS